MPLQRLILLPCLFPFCLIRCEIFGHGTRRQRERYTGVVCSSYPFSALRERLRRSPFAIPRIPSSSARAIVSFSASPPTHPPFCFLFSAEAPGQDFVTLDYRMRYYPSITYAVIGSAVIFVLVVALLALVLHHQRKRSVLLPRGVRGSLHHHQPLLLSRLVILDQGNLHPEGLTVAVAGQYRSNTLGLGLSGALYPSGLSTDSLPSYSQAVQDVR